MPPHRFSSFDHLVLRCQDVPTTLAWYVDALGLAPERVEEWRAGTAPFPSVRICADTVIDLIPAAEPVGERNVDHLCLVADRRTVEAIAADRDTFRVVEGPVPRWGARGGGTSVYVLDPDDTVVEVRHYEG